MIVAILLSGVPVEVVTAIGQSAKVRSLGRENLTQHYAGGVGYEGSKETITTTDNINAVTTIDPDKCEALQNWMDAMAATDRIAEQLAGCSGGRRNRTAGTR